MAGALDRGRRAAIALVAAAMVGVPAGTALAQQQQAPRSQLVGTHGDWEHRCFQTQSGTQSCAIVQIGVSDQQGVRGVMTLAPQNGQVMARFEVPIGVFLPRGMNLDIDGKDFGAVPYQQCYPDRCIALAALNPDQVAALKRGSRAKMIIYANPETPIEVPISLKGITAGLGALG